MPWAISLSMRMRVYTDSSESLRFSRPSTSPAKNSVTTHMLPGVVQAPMKSSAFG